MSTIKIEIDTTDPERVTEVALAIEGLLSVIPEQTVVVSYQEIALRPAKPEPAMQVVEVRGQYTYLADPVELGRPVVVGDTVDVQAVNGGHWSGKVTFVWPVEAYLRMHPEAPNLYVNEIL